MLLAHKIELQPNEAQREYLNKACGTVRHCYNQLLEHFSKLGLLNLILRRLFFLIMLRKITFLPID